MLETQHVPVLPEEIVALGQPAEGETWVDGTGGGGGHAQLLLNRIGSRGRLLILDRDPAATERLQCLFPLPTQVRQASYHQTSNVLSELRWPAADGILLDLGLSSDQLHDQQRGFSFQADGELDMRFDPSSGQPAWQWLASADEKSIADTIYQYGEERFSRRIASRIVQSRRLQPIRTADQLRELIYSCVPRGRPSRGGFKHGRVDPATRTFQALRIAVNQELQILQAALESLPNCLRSGGRLLIISFHSLEDRLVKQAFRQDHRLEIVTRKPVRASEAEVLQNPRSRSAKLRVARRLASEQASE
ncbi:MAG: 16S rRNA (cytosine(1402)-N(4))-methyltransferase RsmH [Pirellulaceae bacterium]|nr:16S rRNA (cytosine(1402)-N(4))-methyltransferase RsmH [Pirellulaceae bacterium]